MPRNKVPPIRVGDTDIVFTVDVNGPTHRGCTLLALRRNGVAMDHLDAETSTRGVVADIRLPDGSEVRDIPHGVVAGNDSSWCRPYIASMTLRFR